MMLPGPEVLPDTPPVGHVPVTGMPAGTSPVRTNASMAFAISSAAADAVFPCDRSVKIARRSLLRCALLSAISVPQDPGLGDPTGQLRSDVYALRASPSRLLHRGDFPVGIHCAGGADLPVDLKIALDADLSLLKVGVHSAPFMTYKQSGL